MILIQPYEKTEALEFFFKGLSEEIKRTGVEVNEYEQLYTSSILAHFVDVSVDKMFFQSLPRPYDLLVKEVNNSGNHEEVENAAAELLYWNGFHGNDVSCQKYRYWYYETGKKMFLRAALLALDRKEERMLKSVGQHFVYWSQRYQDLCQTLKDGHYLLDFPIDSKGKLIVH